MLAVAVWAAAVSSSAPRAQTQPETPPATAGLERTITQYCAACHNERSSNDRHRLRCRARPRGLRPRRRERRDVGEGRSEAAHRRDAAGGHAASGRGRARRAGSFLETTLDRAAANRPNPGRPSPHRLNRAEYANAIRDLLALEVDAAALLPPDDSADGFDNNADVLGVSPALLERYLSAAADDQRARRRRARRSSPSSETYRVRGDASQTEQHEGLPLGTRGGLLAHAHVPARRRVRHQGQAARDQPGLDPRPRVRAPARDHRRRRARAPRAGRRAGGLRAVVAATRPTSSTRSTTRLQVRVAVKAGQRAGRRGVPARDARRSGAIAAAAVPAQHARSRPITSACRTSRT